MQVDKIGRDSILYVESLIESIMGGLEGLINILDSEGGFGSLEIQVFNSPYITMTSRINLSYSLDTFFFLQLIPEQAAFYLNNMLKGSAASFKSPKGLSIQKPGHESHPENSNSVKM